MKTHNGFSLMELMVAIGLTSIISGVMASVLFTMSQSRVAMVNNGDISTYRLEVKNQLKNVKTDGANITRSQCMTLLQPKITQAQLNTMLTNMITNPVDPTNFIKKKAQVSLAKTNMTGAPADRYGSFFIQETSLTNFRRLAAMTTYRKAAPGEVSNLGLTKNSPFVIYILQAELRTAFGPQQVTPPEKHSYMRPLDVNFAIRREAAGLVLLDCGYRDLANVTSQIELCKSFGSDFEFIYDNFDGKNGGQCYAPIYDSIKAKGYGLADYQNGKVMKTPTDYTPLRAFFCDLAQRGKSFGVQFCTGVN